MGGPTVASPVSITASTKGADHAEEHFCLRRWHARSKVHWKPYLLGARDHGCDQQLRTVPGLLAQADSREIGRCQRRESAE